MKGLGRRRGAVEDALRRLMALRSSYRGYRVLVVDRASPTGLARIPVERIAAVTGSALVLDDGSVIPLHRVVGLEDAEGRVTWLRRSGLSSANEPSKGSND